MKQRGGELLGIEVMNHRYSAAAGTVLPETASDDKIKANKAVPRIRLQCMNPPLEIMIIVIPVSLTNHC